MNLIPRCHSKHRCWDGRADKAGVLFCGVAVHFYVPGPPRGVQLILLIWRKVSSPKIILGHERTSRLKKPPWQSLFGSHQVYLLGGTFVRKRRASEAGLCARTQKELFDKSFPEFKRVSRCSMSASDSFTRQETTACVSILGHEP